MRMIPLPLRYGTSEAINYWLGALTPLPPLLTAQRPSFEGWLSDLTKAHQRGLAL